MAAGTNCHHCGCGCGEEVQGEEPPDGLISGDNPPRRWNFDHGSTVIQQKRGSASAQIGGEWERSPESYLNGEAKPCEICASGVEPPIDAGGTPKAHPEARRKALQMTSPLIQSNPKGALDILKRAHRAGSKLLNGFREDAYYAWYNQTTESVSLCFGDDSDQLRHLYGYGSIPREDLDRHLRHLAALIQRAQDVVDYQPAASATASFATVETILRRFNTSVRALSKRQHSRPAFEIENEYDVQDLLFALLKPLVRDLDREDPTKKVAGDSGRIDIVSGELGLAIEVKFCKNAKRSDDVVKECRERVMVYKGRDALKHLVFFIYDPDEHLSDADNVERQMTDPATIGDVTFQITTIVVR